MQNLDEPAAANNTFVSPPPADQNRNSGTRETSLSDVEDFKSADRIESDKLSEEDEEESVEQNSPPPQRPRGRQPARMPDVDIPTRQPTKPMIVTSTPKNTASQETTLSMDQQTQELFPNTEDNQTPKRKIKKPLTIRYNLFQKYRYCTDNFEKLFFICFYIVPH